MNILIFGTPRSGTTSLFFAIKEQLLFGYSEPFNTESGDYYLEKKDIQQTINDNPNFCLKTLVHQMPKSFRKDGYNMLSIIEHFNHLSTMFDKIIFLDRRNYDEHWESYCNLIHKINVRKETGSIDTYGFKQWYSDEITHEIKPSHEFSVFTDVQYKYQEGQLITNVCNKPTDTNTFSQALCYRRIINDHKLPVAGLQKLTGIF